MRSAICREPSTYLSASSKGDLPNSPRTKRSSLTAADHIASSPMKRWRCSGRAASKPAAWKTDCRNGARPACRWRRERRRTRRPIMTVASLPMYDLPEIQAATDAWWRGLARAFRRQGIVEVAEKLWRGGDYRSLWTRPDLLISQTCGYPLMHVLRDTVTLVATPCYSVPGCDGASYCSVVIVRRDSAARDIRALRGARCAINGYDSQSGHNAFRALIAPVSMGKRFFRDVI